MSELPPAGLAAIVDAIGHDAECPSRFDGGDYRHEYCGPSDPLCSVWQTARLIGSSENLHRLLAQVWAQGFTECQMRVSKALMALLPQRLDVTNPYSVTEVKP